MKTTASLGLFCAAFSLSGVSHAQRAPIINLPGVSHAQRAPIINLPGASNVEAPRVTNNQSIIINQRNSPLRIDAYSAGYYEGNRAFPDSIDHEVTLTNISQQAVTAYNVSFITFDVFNEEMGSAFGGVAVESIIRGGSRFGSWSARPYAAFRFKNYGTGVAFVRKVRLADGTVWTADLDSVLAELQEIKGDLTADIFESEE